MPKLGRAKMQQIFVRYFPREQLKQTFPQTPLPADMRETTAVNWRQENPVGFSLGGGPYTYSITESKVPGAFSFTLEGCGQHTCYKYSVA